MIHIIYGDGSVFSGEWHQAPWYDVQIVIYYDPDTGWTLRHGAMGRSPCDFYRMDGDCVVGMDTAGMIGYVIEDLLGLATWDCDLVHLINVAVSSGLVKMGKMLPTAVWQARHRQAIEFRNKLLRDGAT